MTMTTGDVLDGVEAVIVDWDGTVVDSQQANFTALNHALRPYGAQLDRHWYTRHNGLSIIDLLTEITAIHGDLPTTTIIATSRQRLLANLHHLRPIPATIDLLDQAHDRGIPCAVASGAIRPLVHGGIHALRLGHLFTAIVTRDDVNHGKHAPDLYLHAAAMLHAEPHHCLAVDDAADGVAAARKAGMPVLTLRDGQLRWPEPAPAPRTVAEHKAQTP